MMVEINGKRRNLMQRRKPRRKRRQNVHVPFVELSSMKRISTIISMFVSTGQLFEKSSASKM